MPLTRGPSPVVFPTNQGHPPNPAPNQVAVYGYDIAGRAALRAVGNDGYDVSFQPHMGRNNVRMVVPNTGGTAATACTAIGAAFTNSATTLSNPSPASGSLKASTRRVNFLTGATAGTVAYHIQTIADTWRGNAALQGGFDHSQVISLDTLASGQRGFFGLTSGVAAPTNVDPLTTTTFQKIGLAFNLNTGNWFLINNNGTNAPTTLDLGANFTINTTDVLRLSLYCASNTTAVGWRVENLTTNLFAVGTLTTNIPDTSTMLGVKQWMTNNATAAAVGFNLHRWYTESDS